MSNLANGKASRVLAVAVMAITVPSSRTDADTPQPRIILGAGVRDLVVGPGMDVRGKNLRGSALVGQNLTGAVFDGCDLKGVRLYDCNLTNASFHGARLTGGSVDGVLKGADFTDAVVSGCRIRLSVAQLKSTRSYKTKDLRGCFIVATQSPPSELKGVTFRETNLEGAVLPGDVSNFDFSDARIAGTEFRGRIRFEQLASTADFQRRTLSCDIAWTLDGKCDFSGFNLQGARLSLSPTVEANFTDADITGCSFRGGFTITHLHTTRSYRERNLRRVTFQRMDLSDEDLSGMNLTESRFYACDFSNADMQNAVITGAYFGRTESGESMGLTPDQIKSTWNYKHHRMQGIVLPRYLAASFSNK